MFFKSFSTKRQPSKLTSVRPVKKSFRCFSHAQFVPLSLSAPFSACFWRSRGVDRKTNNNKNTHTHENNGGGGAAERSIWAPWTWTSDSPLQRPRLRRPQCRPNKPSQRTTRAPHRRPSRTLTHPLHRLLPAAAAVAVVWGRWGAAAAAWGRRGGRGCSRGFRRTRR